MVPNISQSKSQSPYNDQQNPTHWLSVTSLNLDSTTILLLIFFSHTGFLIVFLKHSRHFPDLGHLHWLFPLPKIFFTHIATWLHPSCVSNLCLNLSFSVRSKWISNLELQLHPSLELLSKVSVFTNFCFDKDLDLLNSLVHSYFYTIYRKWVLENIFLIWKYIYLVCILKYLYMS